MSEYGQIRQKPTPLLSYDHVRERKAARRKIVESRKVVPIRLPRILISKIAWKPTPFYGVEGKAFLSVGGMVGNSRSAARRAIRTISFVEVTP